MELKITISAEYLIDENAIQVKAIDFESGEIQENDIGHASLIFISQSGTIQKDVTQTIISNLGEPNFEFDLLSLNTEPDGYYEILFRMSNETEINNISYSPARFDLYILEILRRIVSQYWAIYAANTDVYKKKDMEEECHWLEMSILGMEALIAQRKIPEYVNLYNFVRKRTLNNKNLFGFQNVIKSL